MTSPVSIKRAPRATLQFKCLMPMERTFSFADIVQGRDASVRVTDDNMLVVVDLVMVMTGKDRDHAGQALRGISDENFSSLKFSERKFPGKGNAHTKLVSFPDAIELVMVLPGKVAKETRTKFADIIRRYLAGDRTLITEIEANAASNAPIAQLARASLDPAEEAGIIVRKRKLEELEIRRLEQDVILMEHEVRAKVTASYRELCADTVIDGRARIMLKDSFLNLLMAKEDQPLLENGGSAFGKPISISGVAAEMKIKLPKNSESVIGKYVRAFYDAKYKDTDEPPPPTHEQMIGGRSTPGVNSYFERDRDCVEDGIKKYAMDKKIAPYNVPAGPGIRRYMATQRD